MLKELFVQISLEHAMVKCLEDTIDMISDVKLAIRVNQVLAQGLKELC